MRVADETRGQWLRRQWHLHAMSFIKEDLLPAVVVVVLLAFVFGLESAIGAGIESLGGHVRHHVPPLFRYLLLGIGCAGLGLLLLRSELRKSGAWTFLRTRIIFGAAGLTILGAYSLLKAAGFFLPLK